MPVTINGTTGVAGVDGSAGTPAIQGGDTNTGMFFPAADTIAFAEGGTEVMRIDSSGNLLFNSGYGSVAIAYGCRAWVNFNGTGTVAIRASGNVTSITDNGTGDYTVNFTVAMSDVNYSLVLSSTYGSSNGFNGLAPTTTAARINAYTPTTGAALDSAYMCVAVFR
jgi:hypothetical protein